MIEGIEDPYDRLMNLEISLLELELTAKNQQNHSNTQVAEILKILQNLNNTNKMLNNRITRLENLVSVK